MSALWFITLNLWPRSDDPFGMSDHSEVVVREPCGTASIGSVMPERFAQTSGSIPGVPVAPQGLTALTSGQLVSQLASPFLTPVSGPVPDAVAGAIGDSDMTSAQPASIDVALTW